MSEDLHIKVIYDIDDSKLTQSLAKVQSNTSKALSGGSSGSGSGGSPQTAIDRSLLQAGKLQDRLKLLGDVQKNLANQPGQERNLAKVNQELARVYGSYKNLSTNSNAYLSNLAKEVEYRKQSTVLMNEANKQAGIYSAHSERQFAMLKQISSQVPGGGLVNSFISGASRGAASGGVEGEGASLLSNGALGGGAAAAGIAAAAAGVALVVSKMGEMASRAQELAQSASSATSALGQLRSQTEKTKIQGDANAVSGGVTIAGIQQSITQAANSFVGGLFNGITGKSPQSKQADIQKAINGGLGGDGGEQWRRIKEAGQDTQLDLARQRQSLDIQQFRQTRDHQLDVKQFDIDSANQLFDIQKNQQRQAEDYAIAKAQFDENQAGKMAKQQFDLQQKYAQQGFANQMQDRAYDYGVSRSRAAQDYSISANDKRYDFNVSQSRNQTEFNINRGRQGQDYQENIMKMALNGADGKSYLFASMDMRKQQQRELEDFNRQKQYATQDYNVSAGRDLRQFGISQSRGQQDFNLANQRSGRDFGISQQQAQDERALQIESMLYARKYEGIQLELQHNRNLQDASIALQRFTQSTGMQRQRLNNQGADIAQDQALQNRDFNIDAYRALRGQSYSQQDFAGQMRKDNPLGAYGQTLIDPTFAAASARYAQSTGQLPLGQQVNSALGTQSGTHPAGGGVLAGLGNLDLFGAIGQGFGQGLLGPLFGSIVSAAGFFGGGGSSGGGGAPFNPIHNVTFPTVGGASQADMQKIQQQQQDYLKALSDLDKKYADALNASVGATGPGFSNGYGY